jgi:hypothetical protein
LPRQFEYLFNEISKIQTKNKFLRERKIGGGSSRKSLSPNMKGGVDNYSQFGENIKEISFEIVCSYSEIYNE